MSNGLADLAAAIQRIDVSAEVARKVAAELNSGALVAATAVATPDGVAIVRANGKPAATISDGVASLAQATAQRVASEAVAGALP